MTKFCPRSCLMPPYDILVKASLRNLYPGFYLKYPRINHFLTLFDDFFLMYFRCYDILVRSHPEKLVSGLLLRLNSVDENIRVSTLIVFRHLMNSSMEVLQPRMSDIFSALHSKLAETSNRVRKMLAQLTVTHWL